MIVLLTISDKTGQTSLITVLLKKNEKNIVIIEDYIRTKNNTTIKF